MKSRKTLSTESGFSLVRVTETDEYGNVLSEIYEVCSPNGKLLGSFSSLKEAQGYLETLLPRPELKPRGPSSGPSM